MVTLNYGNLKISLLPSLPAERKTEAEALEVLFIFHECAEGNQCICLDVQTHSYILCTYCALRKKQLRF